MLPPVVIIAIFRALSMRRLNITTSRKVRNQGRIEALDSGKGTLADDCVSHGDCTIAIDSCGKSTYHAPSESFTLHFLRLLNVVLFNVAI